MHLCCNLNTVDLHKNYVMDLILNLPLGAFNQGLHFSLVSTHHADVSKNAIFFALLIIRRWTPEKLLFFSFKSLYDSIPPPNRKYISPSSPWLPVNLSHLTLTFLLTSRKIIANFANIIANFANKN